MGSITSKMISSFPFSSSSAAAAAAAAASSSSSSSSSDDDDDEKQRWNYDVFLSFSGEDTRNTFCSHLYEALQRDGIDTFIDDEKLERGAEISEELPKAIEESRISIVVLSENYASSTWCLRELVRILECRRNKGHRVLPIFYNVDPSDVRKQEGSFGEALAKHKADGKIEHLQGWKDALTDVGGLSGDHFRYPADRPEAKLIKDIVGFISSKLAWDHTSLSVVDHPVGLDSHGEEVESLLGVGGTSNDVRIIGIWGVGGIGKTTIAKCVYNKISPQFEGRVFLGNVRESSKKDGGLVNLQNSLLSGILGRPIHDINNIDTGVNLIKERLRNKSVLVVLDDVDHGKQLENLVGDPNWFGLGSRIIITTRNKGLLQAMYGSNYTTYDVEELSDNEALELFSWNAFKENYPKCDFVELSKKVVNYAGRLPLALKVLGSFLRDRSTIEWASEIEKLQRIPNNDIQTVLKLSFDGLDRMEKDIFLDVAFFFKGKNIEYAKKILHSSYGYDPTIDLKVLTERSLITTSNNTIGMHDLLQEMGWEIVREQSPKDPGKRSRLSFHEDVRRVLTNNTGTEVVEGIILDFPKPEEVHFRVEVFARMSKLKLLIVFDRLSEDYEYFFSKERVLENLHWKIEPDIMLKDYNIHPSGDISYLSNELRCLKWLGYPSKSMPACFRPIDLVELDLRCSCIEQLWKTNMTPTLENLKFLNLSHSQHFTETPNLSAFPRLEILILEGCTRLDEVHPSNLVLKELVYLNLKDCKSLRSLWESVELESLQNLILTGCSELTKTPNLSAFPRLEMLNLEGCTRLVEVHPSNLVLNKLVYLNLKYCKSLGSLWESIELESLENLMLSGCSKLENLPKVRGTMEHLQEIYLNETGIKKLPSAIKHLTGLVFLNLANCKNLASLPSEICKLKSLKTLNLSGCSKLDKLPENLGELQNLKDLCLDGLAVRELPPMGCLEKLKILSLRDCKHAFPYGFQFSYLTALKSLTILNVRGCNLSDESISAGAIACLSSLRYLNLSRNDFVNPPKGLNELNCLGCIRFDHCARLQELPMLPTSIKGIHTHGCSSLEKLPDPSYLENLRYPSITFSNCKKLNTSLYLQRMHQVPFLKFDGLRYLFTGSEIPEWFEHKSGIPGNSISFKMSSLAYSKFEAVSLCAVLAHADFYRPIVIFCKTKNRIAGVFGGVPRRYLKSDHVWLTYLERQHFLSIVGAQPTDGSHSFELLFCPFLEKKGGVSIKRCGVHIFHREDEVEVFPNQPTRDDFFYSHYKELMLADSDSDEEPVLVRPVQPVEPGTGRPAGWSGIEGKEEEGVDADRIILPAEGGRRLLH